MPSSSPSPTPYTPAILLLIVVWLSIGMPLLFSYESAMEEVQKGLRIGMMVVPFLLLMALMALSTVDSSYGAASRLFSAFLPSSSDSSSIHRLGGSPWGLASFLLLILIMIWYQSDIHDYWNPLHRS